jgi:hypothetical protein
MASWTMVGRDPGRAGIRGYLDRGPRRQLAQGGPPARSRRGRQHVRGVARVAPLHAPHARVDHHERGPHARDHRAHAVGEVEHVEAVVLPAVA